MGSLLTNLVNNLSEGISKTNVNMEMIIKNLKLVELNISIATVFLEKQML